jgi:hypothetical protein
MLILDQLIQNFRLLSGGGGGQCKDENEMDPFAKLAHVFESVKSWTKSRLVGDAAGISGVFMQPEEASDASMQDIGDMGGLDDMWLTEMLGSWSYDFISR